MTRHDPAAYDPPPLEGSLDELTGSTRDLIERLARRNHDVWARQRMNDGWAYGPETDPSRKIHRNLVDYDELSDSEKEYDRLMAIETWKQLIVNGFQVVPPAEDWRAVDAEADERARTFKRRLEAGELIPHAELLAEWTAQERNPRRWARFPSLYGLVAQQLLQVGEPDQCYDVATAGLKVLPGNPALVRWQALALLELSATRRALDTLAALRRRHDDGETRGFHAYAALRYADEIRGRRAAGGAAAKDEAAQERRSLEFALDEYRKASSPRPVWNLMFQVGAAIVATRIGRPDAPEAVRAAADALAAFATTAASGIDEFWQHAFAGQLALLGPEPGAAIDHFRTANKHAEHRHGLVNTCARVARGLAAGLDEDMRQDIEECFALPTVVVFAGHMFDQQGQRQPRFPAGNADAVKRAIKNRLRKVGNVIGYASAAAGADLLFHEAVNELGGDSHVVLPFQREAFFRDSVALPGLDVGRMRDQFDGVLERAVEVSELCRQQLIPGSGSYDYCNRVLFGMALLHADRVSGRLQTVCVWDGKPGNGPGGTAAVAQMWQECGHRASIIDMPPAPPAAADSATRHAPPWTTIRPGETVNHAILFADVRGFSKLSEEQLAVFIDHYLGGIGGMLRPAAPIHAHTAGDGLYMVFRSCRDAGLFGLDLAELRARRSPEWLARGLPEDLDVRVAIHYGPVLFRKDPVTGQPSYFGQHVSRAARLEPITELNSVFVTYEFAAWARTENVTEFACDYLGKLQFAKAYGDSGTYALRRLEGT